MADLTLSAEIIIEAKTAMLQAVEDKLRVVKKLMHDIDKDTKKAISTTTKASKATLTNVRAGKKHESQAKRTAKSLGSLTNMLAKVRVALGLIKFAADLAFKAIAIPAGVVLGISGMALGIASGELAFRRMANSIQVSTGFLKAFGRVMKEANLSIETGVDLIEELPNRLGDMIENPTGERASIFKQLGLDPKKLQETGRESAFIQVIEAIQKQKGILSDAVLSRFGDEAFGGEGNKLITSLLKTNVLLGKRVNLHAELNLLTERESALTGSTFEAFENFKSLAGELLKVGFQPVFNFLETALRTATILIQNNTEFFRELAQEVGENLLKALAFMLRKLISIGNWFVENKDDLAGWVDAALISFKLLGKLMSLVASLLLGVGNSIAGIIKWLGKNEEISAFLIAVLAVGSAMSLWEGLALAFQLTMGKVTGAALIAFGNYLLILIPLALIAAAIFLWVTRWDDIIDGLKIFGGVLWNHVVLPFKILKGIVMAMSNLLKGVFLLITGDTAGAMDAWGKAGDNVLGIFKDIKDTISESVDLIKFLTGNELTEQEDADALAPELESKRQAFAMASVIKKFKAGTLTREQLELGKNRDMKLQFERSGLRLSDMPSAADSSMRNSNNNTKIDIHVNSVEEGAQAVKQIADRG